MGLRVRKTKRLGLLQVRATPRGLSVGTTGRRARLTASKRGVGVSLTLLSGISYLWRRR